jgi:hypothetical protein
MMVTVCEWFGLKTTRTVLTGLALKSVVMVSSGLVSKPAVTVFASVASKPVATVSNGLTSNPVAAVFLQFGLKTGSDDFSRFDLKPVVGFLVEAQNQGGGGFPV